MDNIESRAHRAWDIAAVVVTYNRKELLKENLVAVFGQTVPVRYVVVVDNHSTDGTEEWVRGEYGTRPELVYLRLEENIGGAGGFHEGIRYTAEQLDADYVWLMDDDTIPGEAALENLLRVFERVPGPVGYAASNVRSVDGVPMNVPIIDLSMGKNDYQVWGEYLHEHCVRITSATFVSILVPMDAVRKLGYPVRWFFIWGDDMEYTLRLTRYYGPAYVAGDSIAVHKRTGGRTLSPFAEKDPERMRNGYYYFRNSVINYREYHGKKATRTIIRRWRREAIKGILRKETKMGYKIRTMIRGIRDAYANGEQKAAFQNRMSDHTNETKTEQAAK